MEGLILRLKGLFGRRRPGASTFTLEPSEQENPMAVDFTKPIHTIDADPAEKIRDLDHPTFKHLILVTDAQDNKQTTCVVNDNGDTEDLVSFIENVEPDDAITDHAEEEEVARVTILDLPPALQPIVRHQKRGRGRLVKIREAPEGRPGKTVGIRLDSGPVSGDGGILWCIDKYVRLER